MGTVVQLKNRIYNSYSDLKTAVEGTKAVADALESLVEAHLHAQWLSFFYIYNVKIIISKLVSIISCHI